MAIQQPISTDKQNAPGHSLSHRVFANDDAAPAQTVVVDSAGSTLIGDGGTTNYTSINSSGRTELQGAARVKRHTRIGAAAWQGGVSAPTQGFDGAFVYLEFDNSVDDDAYYILTVPARWDNTTDVEIAVDWYYTGAQDNGTVCWCFEYKSIKAGETVTGAGIIIAKTSAGNHTTGQMVRTVFTTKIPAANLERGDTVALKAFRDVDGGNDSGDTLATGARELNVHFNFTMNRLGDNL